MCVSVYADTVVAIYAYVCICMHVTHIGSKHVAGPLYVYILVGVRIGVRIGMHIHGYGC